MDGASSDGSRTWSWWIKSRPLRSSSKVRIAGRSVCLVLAFSTAPWMSRTRAFSTKPGKEFIMTFGKYNGVRLEKIPRNYIDWMIREGVHSARPELTSALIAMNYLTADGSKQEKKQPARETVTQSSQQLHRFARDDQESQVLRQPEPMQRESRTAGLPSKLPMSASNLNAQLAKQRQNVDSPNQGDEQESLPTCKSEIASQSGQTASPRSAPPYLRSKAEPEQASLQTYVQNGTMTRLSLPSTQTQMSGSSNRTFSMELVRSASKVAVTVPISNFSWSLHNRLLSIPGADIFDRHNGAYEIPLAQHDVLVKVLQDQCELRVQAARATQATQIQSIPPNLVKWLGRQQHATTADDVDAALACIPLTLVKALLPFQRKGVLFTIQQQGRALIGDEMGLGKSIQGIAVAAAFRQEWPMLVVCPSFLRLNWAAELTKWLPESAEGGVKESDITIVDSGKVSVTGGLVTIISYDLAAKRQHELMAERFKVVLADESHYLKNRDAKRTQSLLPILQAASRLVLLSGTPTLARPAELFTQLSALSPAAFPAKDKSRFEHRYCNLRKGKFGMDNSGASNLAELNCVIENFFMIRRLKSQVASQLPPKRRQQVWLEIGAEARRQLERLVAEYKALVAQHGGGALPGSEGGGEEEEEAEAAAGGQRGRQRNQERKCMTELHQQTGLAKLPSVIAYLRDMLQTEHKVIVFAHHLQVLSSIEAAVRKDKVGCMRIDGSVDQQLRHEHVAAFQTDPTVRVALLSITAAGLGLTLTNASNVVFAELHWTPGTMQQAEDRVHRIGQQNPVNIHYLLARSSIDDMMWPSIMRKLRVVGKLLDGHQEVADDWAPSAAFSDESGRADTVVTKLGKQDPLQRRIQQWLPRRPAAAASQLGESFGAHSDGGASNQDLWEARGGKGSMSAWAVDASAARHSSTQPRTPADATLLGAGHDTLPAGAASSLGGGEASLLGDDRARASTAHSDAAADDGASLLGGTAGSMAGSHHDKEELGEGSPGARAGGALWRGAQRSRSPARQTWRGSPRAGAEGRRSGATESKRSGGGWKGRAGKGVSVKKREMHCGTEFMTAADVVQRRSSAQISNRHDTRGSNTQSRGQPVADAEGFAREGAGEQVDAASVRGGGTGVSGMAAGEGQTRAGRAGACGFEDEVDSEDLACPISLTVMEDPVTAHDGHTYDRRNIEEWLETHDTSPMTNERLPSKQLIPNHRMRAIISSVLDKRRRTK